MPKSKVVNDLPSHKGLWVRWRPGARESTRVNSLKHEVRLNQCVLRQRKHQHGPSKSKTNDKIKIKQHSFQAPRRPTNRKFRCFVPSTSPLSTWTNHMTRCRSRITKPDLCTQKTIEAGRSCWKTRKRITIYSGAADRLAMPIQLQPN